MTTALSATNLEQKARALLDTRIAAVRELAETRQALIDARALLETAERADAGAYAACEKSGWSTEELRKLGLDEPTRRTPGRPRNRAPRATAATPINGSGTESPSGHAAPEPVA